ncbi:bifunctional glutamate N-acetyltransferase/amino-acid acetyltransferase ArgJ [Auritidibacter sp. NML100628]|uniref:bifunctional glutamate N-acetyltransferase/amino-acid acetyltransferase ArgJ n=1 Tax=Auritidibacter sp. NML100628 TaxID=2170742 RepID=UPI000D72EB56|nr:bifunctional glutamate N-acetyltransferase/amino-acid acetyltransferase ArgJ [Auritidibacter sp. NML100628]PXA76046.1 bifunctional ornithine acetyltransferase/N-acetylglutamate synthase [Auritidibacter sp. NML100628]
MSVTQAKGFRAAGVASGIKESGAKDLAVIINDGPDQQAAGVFTSNKVKAAPVKWSLEALKSSGYQADAVVLNSGGANACTGKIGDQDASDTAQRAAELLDTVADRIQVCSTGLIGERLKIRELVDGLDVALDSASVAGGDDAAEAIMTTDTRSKTAVATTTTGYHIGGMAKGAGMIAPGMATMLAVITTDAQLEAGQLQSMLQQAVALSFNRADSDGCMSTNDTVLLLANSASGVRPDPAEFQAGLNEVCALLARQIIADAEGAQHDIAVTVVNSSTEAEAETIARAVTRSNLFKTAIYGQDPNWGRVISAVGTVDGDYDPDQIDVTINGVQVCRAGGMGEDRSLVDLSPREAQVIIDLHAGEHTATIWTNDLTYDYVAVNAEYSS